jgi:hypothetical protein
MNSKELSRHFPACELRDLLQCSKRHAQRLRRGHADLRHGERQYLIAVLNNRLIPDAWPDYIQIKNGELLTGCGESLSWGQIEHYSWTCQQWYATVNEVVELHKRLNTLSAQLPIPDKLALFPIGKRLIDAVTQPAPRTQLRSPETYRKYGC